jgi:predicted Rossmann fold nucleotide-binding protein DprA/Smf involved in DNA uptake
MTPQPPAGAITTATLLLNARMGETGAGPRPLSPSEYHQLADWLEARSAGLADLLRADARVLLRTHPGAQRIIDLLARTADVERLIAHWNQLGIWVLGEREPKFPSRLRHRLRTACLPLIFGAGRRETLDEGGLSIVGSRDSPVEAQRFARAAGARAGREGMVVISSDMRGIDREAISAALAAGGRVVCVLSDSLEKAVMSKRYREPLAAGRATLVTPFTPDTRFTVANAMRANRYQYGLSDAAIVVETRQTGGIWSGADENRKHGWVPAFVRADANASPGNNALLHLGLIPITRAEVEDGPSLAQLLIERATARPLPSPALAQLSAPAPPVSTTADLFAVFVRGLASLDRSTIASEEAVARHFGIEVVQARAWLARARSEGQIADLSGPLLIGETESS